MTPKYGDVVRVDMDGVLVSEPTADQERVCREACGNPDVHWSDLPGIFAVLEPKQGAIEAFHALKKHYEVHIVSTAPRRNFSAWSDKAAWVAKYLPEYEEILTLTHHKNKFVGDWMIDDRMMRGVQLMQRESVVLFGQAPFDNWEKVRLFFNV